jgi:predicted permease
MSILLRITNLFHRSKLDQEIDAELRSHIEMRTADNIAAGMSPDEARRDALLRFGNRAVLKERVTAADAQMLLDSVWQDLCYGLRMLRKSPGFTAVAVLTLALGIGANTAIFSLVDAVLLHSLPYGKTDRLVMVWEEDLARGWFHNTVSAADFLDWRKENRVFTQIAAFHQGTFDMNDRGEPMEVEGEQVSGDFFSVLGVSPVLGRAFLPDEDRPVSPRVAVLSNGLWKERFGADRSLIGREITIDGNRFTVVGIMGPDFYFPPRGSRSQIWMAGLDLRNPNRTAHNFQCIARMKSGVTLAQARADMDAISLRIQSEYSEDKGWGAELISLHDETVGNTRPALLVLFAAVCFVLLIACANVANLELARTDTRQGEIAVRIALGASRARMVRQLLTESVVLSIAGGGLGLVLAYWGVGFARHIAPQGTPGINQVGLNVWVLVFTVGISLIVGLAFGLTPAFGASTCDLNLSLKNAGRSRSGGAANRRHRGLLVSSEFAVALVLFVGAGLLIKSFVLLSRVELGFDPHHVITMRIVLNGPRYATGRERVSFFHQLVQRVEAMPGVNSAGILGGGGLPPDGGNGWDFLISGRPRPAPNQQPNAVRWVANPDYFHTMGMSLLRGRLFTADDTSNSPPVAVINAAMARQYWHNRDPIGSQIQFPPGDKSPWFTVVGIVSNIRNWSLEDQPLPEVYVCYTQSGPTPWHLLLRSTSDPAGLVRAVRHQVELLDKEQPVSDVRTMDDVLSEAEAGHRFPMILLGVFAALALILAAAGIYAVVSYTTEQRTHEIGVRMALGAQHRDVLRLIIGQGIRFALFGIVIGLAAAFGLTRLMSSLLFGIRATDSATFAGVALLLTFVALAACYIPARRAMKVDPMVALRYE